MASLKYEIEADSVEDALEKINVFVQDLDYGGSTVNVRLPLDSLQRADLEKYTNG